LLEQFNRILPTTDTERGLKVNMGDVLFDTGKYDLRPPAREALAKLSGIILAHPGLQLSVEGFTDSVGSDAFNQDLSEQRANEVRAYLVNQNLPQSAVTSRGFGKTMPISSNDTPQGRQQNRRVEIIVSGEVIGTKIGGPAPSS
jgi:outer membrane protein OmpA-like peptidoglycan-associated protein